MKSSTESKLNTGLYKSLFPILRIKQGALINVTWYTLDDSTLAVTSVDHPVCFSTAYPDVPFISDSRAIDVFLEYYQYTDKSVKIDTENGLKHRFELPTKTYVDFEYELKQAFRQKLYY